MGCSLFHQNDAFNASYCVLIQDLKMQEIIELHNAASVLNFFQCHPPKHRELYEVPFSCEWMFHFGYGVLPKVSYSKEAEELHNLGT